MPTTGTWLLPTQAGTDRPCDLADSWCALVGIVDTVLTSAQAAVSIGRARAVAKIVTNSTLVPDLTTTVQEDRVPITMVEEQLDTDGMVDLELRPTQILPSQTGVFLIFPYVEMFTPNAQTDTLYLSGALNASQLINDSDSDSFITGSSEPMLSIVNTHRWVPPMEGFAISVANSAAVANIGRAELVVLRIGDAP